MPSRQNMSGLFEPAEHIFMKSLPTLSMGPIRCQGFCTLGAAALGDAVPGKNAWRSARSSTAGAALGCAPMLRLNVLMSARRGREPQSSSALSDAPCCNAAQPQHGMGGCVDVRSQKIRKIVSLLLSQHNAARVGRGICKRKVFCLEALQCRCACKATPRQKGLTAVTASDSPPHSQIAGGIIYECLPGGVTARVTANHPQTPIGGQCGVAWGYRGYATYRKGYILNL